jgi:hypothetical protein
MSSSVIRAAQRLRDVEPETYGYKGSTKGAPGYVRDGWKKAIKHASQNLKENGAPLSYAEYRTSVGKPLQTKPKVRLSKEQKQIKQEYNRKQRALVREYYPILGKKVPKKAAEAQYPARQRSLVRIGRDIDLE